jgi:16S rRNA (guanine966-N2)-methyltransferase
VFSSIGSFVVEASVADLFAGAGSFGIESLSRGAASSVFVENGRKALDALRRNLADLDLPARSSRPTLPNAVRPAPGPFDLVFCDPPWPLSTAALGEILEHLIQQLAGDALVIVTRRATDEIPYPVGIRD